MTLPITLLIPDGIISDRYEISDGETGVYIEHDVIAEDGDAGIGRRAAVCVVPQALPGLIAALIRVQRERANV